MPTFSQRRGYSPLERAFQRESVDTALRTKLWNVLKVVVWDRYEKDGYHYPEVSQKIDQMVKRLWFHFFNNDLDNLPDFKTRYATEGAYDTLKEYFLTCEWYKVYDLLEAIAADSSELLGDESLQWINRVLEQQNAAYRFVGAEVVEITDQHEIEAIECGLEHPDKPVRMHLEAALRMLSDREAPDYRNSVKESISAVEAACRLVCGDKSATLGDALKKVRNLHPALSRTFNHLYGFTSDASGVRHSLIEEPTVDYADAKFMLVACSAFVSYLVASTTLR